MSNYLASSNFVNRVATTWEPGKIKNGIIFEHPGPEWTNQKITGHVDVVYRQSWASHANFQYSGYPYGYRFKTDVYH